MMAPARPVAQESKKTVESKNVSSPHPSDTARGGNEQLPSSGANAPATPRDTTGGVEQRTALDTGAIERPPAPKSHLFSAGVRRVRSKLQHAKDVILRSLRVVICCLGDRNSIQEPIQIRSATHLPIRSLTGDEPLHSNTMQDEEKGLRATPLYTGHQQISRNPMNVDEEMNDDPKIQTTEPRKRPRARTRDTEDSDNFINPADKYSALDVIQAVQRLNAELEQSALYIVDSLKKELEFSNVTRLTEESVSAVQRASEHVGKALMDLLGIKTSDEHLMLLQIAVQAYFASALYGLVPPFASEPGDNGFDDDSFRTADACLHSPAHVYITHDWTPGLGSLVKGIVAGLSDVLVAAGCTDTQSDVTSKVMSMFEKRIILLVELAVRLHKMLDEVLSTELFVVRPGEAFERQRMELEDPEDDQAEIQGPVLCTTKLGLVTWIGEASVSELEKEKKQVISVRAKVLLESFLDAGS